MTQPIVPGPAVAPVSSTASASLLPSVLRTVVPVLVGLILTGLIKLGVHIDDGALTNLVTAVVTGVYYAVVRYAEIKLGPAWGWLLGLAKAPAYSTT